MRILKTGYPNKHKKRAYGALFDFMWGGIAMPLASAGKGNSNIAINKRLIRAMSFPQI